jgi:hypothetical protein
MMSRLLLACLWVVNFRSRRGDPFHDWLQGYVFAAISDALSPHPKIPFPTPELECEVRRHGARSFGVLALLIRDFG